MLEGFRYWVWIKYRAKLAVLRVIREVPQFKCCSHDMHTRGLTLSLRYTSIYASRMAALSVSQALDLQAQMNVRNSCLNQAHPGRGWGLGIGTMAIITIPLHPGHASGMPSAMS